MYLYLGLRGQFTTLSFVTLMMDRSVEHDGRLPGWSIVHRYHLGLDRAPCACALIITRDDEAEVKIM
jgi:hypothetical protein